jgi:hypothetical protein
MDLPSTLEKGFRREVDQYEEGRSMPYVTGIERLGMLRLIEDHLRTKFGEEGAQLMPAIEELNDAEKYLALSRVILTTTNLDEVRQAIADVSRPRSRRKTKRIRSKGEPG